MSSAVYFRQKAEQCRRLAKGMLTRNDPAVLALQALAVEFDHKATALESETAAALLIGYGDDIGDRSVPTFNGDGKGNGEPAK
jgi:hypothetical protein